jgi:hypothetical protein
MSAEKTKQSGMQKQMQGLVDNLTKMEAQHASLVQLHNVVQQQRKQLEVHSQCVIMRLCFVGSLCHRPRRCLVACHRLVVSLDGDGVCCVYSG